MEMGEAASPVCFELAKRLKKAPRQIAQEIAGSFGKVEGIARVEVAGGGYLNAYFDRGAFWNALSTGTGSERPKGDFNAEGTAKGKIIVEHTSINQNKAAHIGHVRNAVRGHTLVREPKLDYYCWDLYAKATSFFAEDPQRAAKLRAETLKAIEENRGEDAE